MLGVAILSGIGLANYTVSGAFSFYKNQKQAERHDQSTDLRSDAATMPVSVYSSTSTPDDSGWVAPPSARSEEVSVSDGAIDESVYVASREDDLEQNPDIQRITPEPKTEPSESTPGHEQFEPPSVPDDTDESPKGVLPGDSLATVPTNGGDPARGHDEPRN